MVCVDCNIECSFCGEKDEPCWGNVNCVGYESFGVDEDGYDDYYWIHACEGHYPMYNHGGYDGQYLKEP